MKRLLGMGLVLGVMAPLAGCGWYTNVPAQIHVKSVAPSAITVTYKEPGTGAKATYDATISDAVLTLAGDPGSIGATFYQVKVDFTDGTTQDDKGNPAKATGLSTQAIDMSFRVEPSVFREDPRKDELGTKNWEEGKLIIGTGQMSLGAIVNRQVLDYGFKRTSNVVTALVTLSGYDDAKFPTSVTVNVPITFTGYAQ
ncbi:hypothetical protein D3C72_120230 [compost metagenome]